MFHHMEQKAKSNTFPQYIEVFINQEIKIVDNNNKINSAITQCIHGFSNSNGDIAFYDDELIVLGYLINYLPIFIPQISFICSNLQKYTSFFSFIEKNRSTLKLLDIGCGPATSTLGVLNFMEEHYNKEYEITLVDQSIQFLNYAQEIMECHPNKSKITVKKVYNQVINFNEQNSFPSFEEKFDLIFFSHVIEEKNPSNEQFLHNLSHIKQYLDDNGIIIINPVASKTMHEWLNVNCNEIGLYRIAPCLHIDPNIKYSKRNMFQEPCGDLCRFILGEIDNPFQGGFKVMQGSRENSCSFLVFSKKPETRNYNKNLSSIQSIHSNSKSKGNFFNIIGIFASDNPQYKRKYFCDGSGKFVIEDFPDNRETEIKIGDCYEFHNLKYDRTYRKKNKPYFEMVFKWEPTKTDLKRFNG
jgi:SAM-dependent methyltransferase